MDRAQTPASRQRSPLIVRAVLFDFDYTLADSSSGIVRCIDHALTGLGLPPAPPEVARQTIGLSLPDTLTFLLGEVSAEQKERFAQLFLEMSERIMVDQTMLLPGTRRAVTQLLQSGFPLGVVSTKYRRRIEAVLEREGLRDAFDVLIGGDDVSQLKPAPEGLLLAASHLGIDPAHCLYVGDSPTDAEAADLAGMPFVATLSGVTSPEVLASHQPLALIPDVGALPTWLDQQCNDLGT